MKNKSLISRQWLLLCLPLLLWGFGTDKQSPVPKENAGIEVLAEELHEVLNTEKVPEVLGEGYRWAEGPVWVSTHDFLLFSDVPANTIYKWSEGESVRPYLSPSGYTGDSGREGEIGSNGLIIGNNGDLLLCQHGNRAIAKMKASVKEPEPDFTFLASEYDGKRFDSPNDLVQHSNGRIYFTDPPYGLEEYVNDPSKEMEAQGVYRVDPDGTVTRVIDDLTRPNGLAFSPDESLLYVANSDRNRAVWMVYDVLENGDLENGRLFYDVTDYVGTAPGLPDGMKVRSDGYIFATGPGGVWIFSPDAVPLGRIYAGEFISNCAFDANEDVLYMTANSFLLRLQLR